MLALCLDPGTEKSGIVLYDGISVILSQSDYQNEALLNFSPPTTIDVVVIEKIVSYGMAVGQTTLDTCVWIGRFIERFGPDKTVLISRKDVKLQLCNSLRAKDANVRQAVMDKFPATGGGKTPVVGTIKQPGPLYGVSGHAWSALALGITYFETLQSCENCR